MHMKNRLMRVCCLLLMICIAAAWLPAAAEGYTIGNIREFVAGLDEPVELENGTTRPQINFDNAATTPALIPVMDEVNRKLLKLQPAYIRGNCDGASSADP